MLNIQQNRTIFSSTHATAKSNSTVISLPCKIDDVSSQNAPYVKHTSAVNKQHQFATAHLYKYT
jgi:hypothetical protein